MIRRGHFLSLYALLIGAGLYLHLHRDLGVPMKEPFERFPVQVSRWRMTGESRLSDQVQSVLRATDVMLRQYVNPEGERVELYVGYHDGARGTGEIHSPKHCLPGSGWHEVSSRRTELATPAGGVNLVRAVYQKGDSRELFLYWYQVRDACLSDEYSLKAAQIGNSVLYRRRDASFVRVSIPFQGDEARALATGERFVRDFLPAIRSFLPG